MLALFIIGFVLIVVGSVLMAIVSSIGEKDIYMLLIPFLGFMLFGIALGVGYEGDSTNPEIILAEDINYKSIDLQGAEYYIVDDEGNIYEVTQEQWNGLDVPIIPMINK